MDTKELVKKYWNDRPCNIKHSKKEFGSIEYFNEVEQKKYFVEPHIPEFAEFKKWLWDNYRKDDNFWKDNHYGCKRWEGILKFIQAEDHTHLLPDFKEYVDNLDSVRGLNAKSVFPELGNVL